MPEPTTKPKATLISKDGEILLEGTEVGWRKPTLRAFQQYQVEVWIGGRHLGNATVIKEERSRP